MKNWIKIRSKYHYSVILLKQLVKTDFKLRYQGSVLGYMWSLLKPLALFGVLYVVFVRFLRFGDAVPHFASYLLLGVVLWTFFAEITNGSINAIVGKGDLMRKINFPRYVVVVAGSVSALINLTFNMIVIAFFMYMQGVDISFGIFWVPLLLFELFVFSLGVAFLLSSLFVRFRDLNHIWEVMLQAGFYATPIIYPFTLVTDTNLAAAKIMILSPVAQIIQDIRQVMITPETITITDLYASGRYRLIPILAVVVVSVIGGLYFRRKSRSFAEEV